MSNAAPQPEKGRLRQMRQAYRITKNTDPNIGLILLLWFVLVGGLFAVGGFFLFGTGTFGIILTVVFALMTGLLAVLIVFGRRAEKAAYAQAEGQRGASAGALGMLKRGWDLKTEPVAVTRNQDVVFRVVGRPGIILVGEGNGTRVRGLLASEKKRHSRIAGEEIPVHLVVVGRGEDEVPLTKLLKHVQKLPKALKPAEQTAVMNKLKALDSMRPGVPIPRGPMPTNLKGARRAMRG